MYTGTFYGPLSVRINWTGFDCLDFQDLAHNSRAQSCSNSFPDAAA